MEETSIEQAKRLKYSFKVDSDTALLYRLDGLFFSSLTPKKESIEKPNSCCLSEQMDSDTLEKSIKDCAQ